MKQEFNSKLEDLKKNKDREIKKMKDEIDRLKKSHDDKVAKMISDNTSEREAIEREYKEKIDNLNVKAKKDIKNA